MSSSNIAVIVAFIAGGALGLVVGQRLMEKKYQSDISVLHDEIGQLTSKAKNVRETMRANLAGRRAEINPVDESAGAKYHSLARGYGNSEYSEQFPDSDDPITTPSDQIPPFEVQYEDVDYDSGDVSCVTFYKIDGVLTDERDQKIDDPIEIVGRTIWKRLHDESRQTIFVQNNSHDCVYEVVVEKLSYKKDILGE